MVSTTGFIESGYDIRDYVLNYPQGFELPKTCDYSDMISKIKDQGNTMKCVPYSLSYVLELDHKLNGEEIIIDIDDIYKHRTNSGGGMQIREALKYIKKQGYKGHHIKSYWKLPSSLIIKYNLLTNGPCIMALPVYSDKNDFWNGHDYQGGHAICCIGYDENGFILLNTWGRNFGDNGKCYLPYSEMNKIIEAWGVLI